MLEEILTQVKNLISSLASGNTNKVERYSGEFETENFPWNPGTKNILYEFFGPANNSITSPAGSSLRQSFIVNIYAGVQEKKINTTSLQLAEDIYNELDGASITADNIPYTLQPEVPQIKIYHTGVPVYIVQIKVS